MEIVKTYIVLITQEDNVFFNNEYCKVHLLKNGRYFRETKKGELKSISLEYAKSLGITND